MEAATQAGNFHLAFWQIPGLVHYLFSRMCKQKHNSKNKRPVSHYSISLILNYVLMNQKTYKTYLKHFRTHLHGVIKRENYKRRGLLKTGAHSQKRRKDRDEERNEKWTQGNLKCKWKSEDSKAQNWHHAK